MVLIRCEFFPKNHTVVSYWSDCFVFKTGKLNLNISQKVTTTLCRNYRICSVIVIR